MKTAVASALAILLLPAGATAAERWQFALSPYAWLAGVDGKTATIPPLPEAPIEISPKEALEDTEVGYMLVMTAKKGRHGLLADLVYTDVRSGLAFVDALDLSLDSGSRNKMYTLAYSYELVGNSASTLDAFAGVRYWDVDTRLQFSGGSSALAGRRIDNGERWLDPMLGLKGRRALGDAGFFLGGSAAVGGFEANSEVFFDGVLNLGYRWSNSVETTLGYRIVDVEYDNSGFLYDVRQEGVTLGLSWRF